MTENEIRQLVRSSLDELAEMARLARPRLGTHRFVIDISEAGVLECRYHHPNGHISVYGESQLPFDPDALTNLTRAKLATGVVPWFLDTNDLPAGPLITVVRRLR